MIGAHGKNCISWNSFTSEIFLWKDNLWLVWQFRVHLTVFDYTFLIESISMVQLGLT